MRTRDRLILLAVFAAVAFGILQGLPDAVDATTTVLLTR